MRRSDLDRDAGVDSTEADSAVASPRRFWGLRWAAGRGRDGLQVPGLDLGRAPLRADRADRRVFAALAVDRRGFRAGWAVVMTPWLAKNVIDTGNPVYPLGYRVFGGRHWDGPRCESGRACMGRDRSRRVG